MATLTFGTTHRELLAYASVRGLSGHYRFSSRPAMIRASTSLLSLVDVSMHAVEFEQLLAHRLIYKRIIGWGITDSGRAVLRHMETHPSDPRDDSGRMHRYGRTWTIEF